MSMADSPTPTTSSEASQAVSRRRRVVRVDYFRWRQVLPALRRPRLPGHGQRSIDRDRAAEEIGRMTQLTGRPVREGWRFHTAAQAGRAAQAPARPWSPTPGRRTWREKRSPSGYPPGVCESPGRAGEPMWVGEPPANALACVGVWSDGRGTLEFRELSRRSRSPPGVRLPGRSVEKRRSGGRRGSRPVVPPGDRGGKGGAAGAASLSRSSSGTRFLGVRRFLPGRGR